VVRTRAHSQFNSVPRRLSRSVLSTDPTRLRFCAGSGHFGGIFGIKPPRGILSSDWPCGPWTYLVVRGLTQEEEGGEEEEGEEEEEEPMDDA